MNRLHAFVLLAVLSGSVGLTACASKPVTSTAESGTLMDEGTVAKLIKGTTTEAEAKAVLGADPAESKVEEDGRTLWVYAWSRATADNKGTVHALEVRALKIWFKDGVVDDTDYAVTKQ